MPLWTPAPQFPIPGPAGVGMQAYSSDPGTFNNFTILASGTIYASQVTIPAAMTVSNITVFSSVTGATLTAGQNFLGLYSASGVQLATVNTDALFASAAGTWTAAITPTTLPPGVCYVLILCNGTTPPTLLRSLATGLGNQLAVPSVKTKWGRVLLGQTALPASFSSVTDNSTGWFWAGLS